MGASYKGNKRLTAITNRRNSIIPTMLSTLSYSRTATFSPGTDFGDKQVQLQKIPAHMLIELIATAFPQFGSFAYLVYFGYKVTAVLLQDQKEYRNLKMIIQEEQELIQTIGKYVLENGITKVTDNLIKNKIKDKIENEITNLLVNKIFQQIIKKSVGNDQKRQEKFQTMIATGFSQFIVGSLTGSSDEVIIKAARILSSNVKISDSQYEQYLNQIFPINMIIASIKLQLVELLTDHIVSIAKDIGIKITKKDKDDIGVVIEDVVSSLSPSIFKIPFELQPSSERSIKKVIEQIKKEEITKIISLVIKGLKQRQTNLGEYL